MTRVKHTRRRPIAEINVVPYIDVMLVLLVIFIITAPLLTQGVKVELPQAASEPLPRRNQEPLVASVDAAGSFYLNVGENSSEPVDAATLLARVAAVLRHRPETPILVRGDRNVPYGRVINAMTLLQQAGAPSVGMMTEAPPNQPVR